MQLPNRANANISPKKLREYLLSKTHPVGMFKAKVFTAVGFTEQHINSLSEGLLAIAHTNEVREVSKGPMAKRCPGWSIAGSLWYALTAPHRMDN
jgi:hypothetical protein